MQMPKHIYLKMSQQGHSAERIKEFTLFIKSVYTPDTDKEWEMFSNLHNKYSLEAKELKDMRGFESSTPDQWKDELKLVVQGMFDVCGK